MIPPEPAVTDLWEQFDVSRDPRLRQQLIEQYIPLVRFAVGRMAMHYPAFLERQDILSTGAVGLIEAVDRYDPSRGVKFQTYALQRIRGQILDTLRRHDPVTRSARRRAREIEAAVADLERDFGVIPSDTDVARRLGVSVEEYHHCLTETQRVVISLDSADARADEDEGLSIAERLADERADLPDWACERRELLTTLSGVLNGISARDQLVLRLYYFEERTLREIGQSLGVSEARVSQIHARILRQLRALMTTWRPVPAVAGSVAGNGMGKRR